MQNSGELDHIREQIDSLRNMIDSLSRSINSNMSEILQRLVSMERWEEAHERLDDLRHEQANRAREALEEAARVTAAELKELENESQQRKGMVWAMRAAWVVLLAGVELIVHWKKP